MRARFHLQIVVIHQPGLFLQIITDGVEHQTGEIDSRTVAQVSAVAQVETHERVAGFEASHENRHVRLCAAVRLNVHIFGIVELFEPLAGDVLRNIDHLATAVIAVSGIALRIFVGQHAAHGLHDLVAHKILAGD